MAGVNWPAAGETMVPEGLQYASIPDIITKIKSIGMNVIRLTWAVQMVDDIFDLPGGDVKIRKSFNDALGERNGTIVYDAIMKNNPTLDPEITRLGVFDAIAKECAAQGIYVHLDNHVSKAGWCCKERDGNAWFGDIDFNIAKWMRALEYMADHGKAWPNLVSMALRNELRRGPDSLANYNWNTWYGNMTAGAEAVYKANPDILIYFSGLGYDTELRPIFADEINTPGSTSAKSRRDINFNKTALPYGSKIVLEVHDYDFDGGDTNCTEKQWQLRSDAFEALDPPSPPGHPFAYPLVVSEWGYGQSPDQIGTVYATCLRKFLPEQEVGWMTWALGGSYYVREGVQDHDEAWGLLDHGWKGWRCEECVLKGLVPMVEGTLGGLRKELAVAVA
ncbi:MAG: hypothetical protein Q9207_008080 [Kuettlingeria erythrocarpa]